MTNNKIQQISSHTIEYCFLALFFFTPLIFWPQTSEVFEFNKMLFVYTLTAIITSAWIITWIANRKVKLCSSPLNIPIIIFLLFQILSTYFSIHPHTSLWGYYSRFHGGLVSTISYIILYYALISNIANKSTISNIKYAILSSATLVSLYAILEHFGIDKHLWIQDVQNRVFSTLGQPNWLSAYLVALLPLPIYMALQEKNKKKLTIYNLIAIIFFIAILFTKSQSGIATTFIILFLIALHLSYRHKKTILFFLANLTLILTVFYIKPQTILKPLNSINKINPFYSTTEKIIEQENKNRIGGSDSMTIRRVVWQGAITLGKKYPFFGTGPETFGYTYFSVRPKQHNSLSEWEFLYNKAHNEYLNFLANTGFLGLISYTFLIISTLWFFIRTFQLSTANYPLFLGYLSILITNFFGFSVVAIGLFFFLLPALVTIKSNQNKTFSLNLPPYSSYFIIPTLTVTFYILLTILNSWRADLNYNKGKNYYSANFIESALLLLEKAHQLKPNEALFTIQLAEAQAQAAAALFNNLQQIPASQSAETKAQYELVQKNFQTQALENIDLAIIQNPYHTNIYKTKTKAELFLGLIDPKYNKQALNTMLKLHTLAPTDSKILFNIGVIYEDLNDKDNARKAYEKALELKPDYDAAKSQLNQLK